MPHSSPVQRAAEPSGLVLDDPLPFLLLGVAGGAFVASRGALPRRAHRVAALATLAMVGVAAYGPLTALVRRAGTRRRGVELQLSFIVNQPVERVFAFCRDFENYPRFFGSLRNVRDFGDGRSRWCVSTPAGQTLEWNAVTTKYVPNRVIAWQTAAGSPVHATGLLRFKPEEGRTCIQAMFSYEPLDAGPMRESIAALLSPPRRRLLEADIEKLVHYLNTAPAVEFAAYGV